MYIIWLLEYGTRGTLLAVGPHPNIIILSRFEALEQIKALGPDWYTS